MPRNQDPASKRGRSYHCTKCPYEGELRKSCFHFMKCHLPMVDVPFYCTLCGYRSFNERQLEQHTTEFGLHEKLRKERPNIPDSVYLIKNPNARGVIKNVDVVCRSLEESRNVWVKRKSATVTSSENTVFNELQARILQLEGELRQNVAVNTDQSTESQLTVMQQLPWPVVYVCSSAPPGHHRHGRIP